MQFLQQVFFILRKKNNQVTFLHVYHHSTMLVICWYVAKYVPGGESKYCSYLNNFLHHYHFHISSNITNVMSSIWIKNLVVDQGKHKSIAILKEKTNAATGLIKLNDHKNRINLLVPPMCRHSGYAYETVEHYLLHCGVNLKNLRDSLLPKLPLKKTAYSGLHPKTWPKIQASTFIRVIF